MHAHDREVAGLRCTEVLAVLSDYLDHDLPAGRAEQIDAHLRGCDWCERFGGEFKAAVALLRKGLTEASPLTDDVRRRLRERVRRETDPNA